LLGAPNEVVCFPKKPKGYRVELDQTDLGDLRLGIAMTCNVGAVLLQVEVDGRRKCLPFKHSAPEEVGVRKTQRLIASCATES
jgi:hypothetical protein